jgi:hypothetical protein
MRVGKAEDGNTDTLSFTESLPLRLKRWLDDLEGHAAFSVVRIRTSAAAPGHAISHDGLPICPHSSDVIRQISAGYPKFDQFGGWV